MVECSTSWGTFHGISVNLETAGVVGVTSLDTAFAGG